MVWLVIQVKKVAFLGGLDRVILEELYEIVNNRKNSEEEGSYTKYLLEKGTDKILKKVGEECTEVIKAMIRMK